MGYIKKLKNNELVGGTDKTTVYPVTSAEAVFEEVSENEFKSQKYLNNHITNERIVDNTIENDKLKDDTIDMGKLNTQLKTIIQNAYDASWKVKEEPFSLETKYDANDVVYDPDTNSSYVSLTADNQGNPVNPEDEGYVEGKWRIVINGISAVESTEVINAKVEELETEVDNKIDDAQGQLDQMIADAAASLADAESDARGAAAEASAVVANKVADAQIGYFECNTAAGTALKQTTLDYIGTGNDKSYYTIPAAGSNVRIKMKYANTASGTVELQFGTNTATKKQLIYSGEPASQNNSWDDGEVLSIYYDPTYNNNTGAYQASNTMGGGSSVKKKTLTFSSGFYDTSNAPSQGAAPSSRTSNASFKSAKVPVSEGDFLVINGKASQYVNSRFWATIDSSNNYVKCSGLNAGGTDYIIIIPEGVAAIVINCDTRVYANPSGYLLKEGNTEYKAVTDLYIYGDLRTPALGQTYKEGEAIKTADKQLLRLTKEVAAMNLVDTITVGDLKAYGSGSAASTYKALREVKKYNGTETEGLYAIGRPSVVTITVDATSLSIEEDTDVTVTIGESTQTITVPAAASETKAADIAALIATAFASVPGWTLSDNEDGTLTLRCNTGGPNTITVSSNVGETGLSITSSAVSGAATLSKYAEGTWAAVTLADYAADSINPGETADGEMWQKLSLDDLLSIATVQNSLAETVLNDFKFLDFTSEAISGKRLFNSGGIGNQLGSVNSHADWKYIKKAVSAGDVIKITGYATGGDALLWTVVNSENIIIATETAIRAGREDYIIVIPEDAAYIVINNYNPFHTAKWQIARSDSFIEKYEQEITSLEEDIKRNTPNEIVVEGVINVEAIKERLLYVNSGLENNVEYLFSFTFNTQLVSPVEVRLYSQASFQSSYFAIQRLPAGKSYYEFNYTPKTGYSNQYIGVYNNNSFPLNINVKVFKKGDASRIIEELRTDISAYGDSVVGETVQIPVNYHYGVQWGYSGNKVIQSINNGTILLEPIDVRNYDKVLIKCFVNTIYQSTTAFTDDENNIIGQRINQTLEPVDYVMYDVPEGATKLYVTSSANKTSANTIGVRGILNSRNLSNNVENIVNNSSMQNSLSNIFIDYRFDAATGSYFTVVRVHKLKIDGTYQYPHIFAPFGVGPRQWSTLEMNRKFGFAVAMNAGLFDVTTGSPTIGCPRGTLVVNGVVLQQQVGEDTARKYRFLTIDSNGNLGWQPQTVTGEEMVSQGIVDAIAGWEPIIEDYAAIETYCEPGSSFQRQIIGQFGNDDYAIVTSEGRGNMVSDGWTSEEAQAICIGLGLKFAYRLDGGGSTETVVGKKQINTIYEGSAGRAVPTYIVFNGKTTI